MSVTVDRSRKYYWDYLLSIRNFVHGIVPITRLNGVNNGSDLAINPQYSIGTAGFDSHVTLSVGPSKRVLSVASILATGMRGEQTLKGSFGMPASCPFTKELSMRRCWKTHLVLHPGKGRAEASDLRPSGTKGRLFQKPCRFILR